MTIAEYVSEPWFSEYFRNLSSFSARCDCGAYADKHHPPMSTRRGIGFFPVRVDTWDDSVFSRSVVIVECDLTGIVEE